MEEGKMDEYETLKTEKGRLEGYLQVYSERITTLSSIIQKYQTYFKSMSQVKEQSRIDMSEGFSQYESQGGSEDRFERLISLKNILISE